MFPKMTGIDHVHVYVADWARAEDWYRSTLGFTRVAAFDAWAVPGGPLTLENADGNVHLALFEKDNHQGSSAIAFGATGEEFLEWKKELENRGLELRITDHRLAYSLYFHDPDKNLHEITTYDHERVRAELNP